MTNERTISSRESAELRHGLRTPINHLIGYAELLLEDHHLPPTSEPYLSKILVAAQQAHTIVAQRFATPESGIQTGDLESLRLDLEGPVTTICNATRELERLEGGAGAKDAKDIERIRLAAEELLKLATGNAAFAAVIASHERPLESHESEARIVARLLVVDDAEADREMLCRMLERQGHICVTASSGEEALERLRTEKFDMVLLDLMMPGMNGIETLRAIKKQPELEDVAVVMLSAFDEVDEIGQCLKIGAEDYLFKPYDRTLLNARLQAILERKRLQNVERRRTLELEIVDSELRRSNDELRRFASVVSHDLQEPLRMVISYMQLLERDLGPNLTANQREYLDYAIDGGRRMSELIQDLLAYSRASSTEPDRELLDLNEIVEQVKLHLRAAIEESGANIVIHELPQVHADCSQVRQLFQNLLSNAIKYRGERAPVISVSAKKVDNGWLFAVADNGVGIAPEDRQRIFDMFSRLHRRNVPGTGIGLSICQRVVERLGGRIWVDSSPGQGSTFYFTIPE